jgi:PIN domain nuclease of toxin-antitoxin system
MAGIYDERVTVKTSARRRSLSPYERSPGDRLVWADSTFELITSASKDSRSLPTNLA